jgi:hypothetical protein
MLILVSVARSSMPRPRRLGALVAVLAAGALVAVMPASVVLASQGSREAVASEVERLSERVAPLWSSWVPAGESREAPARDARADAPDLVSWAVAGGGRDALEADVARGVAQAFWRWASRAMPPPPRFADGERDVPGSWARSVQIRYALDEARAVLAALHADEDEHARTLASRIVAARFRRVAVLAARELSDLRRREQAEGLASYTAYHALLVGRHPSYEPGSAMVLHEPDFAYVLAPRLRSVLLERLGAVADGDAALYTPEVSGFAIALVLDRVRPGWRDELLDGWKPLDALLAAPVRRFGNRPPAPASEPGSSSPRR